jgi:uncharacterized membrane protein YhfC
MDLLTITHFLNWLLMIAMPILLGIYLTEKFHLGWRLWLIGAATFVISQVLHIPFNSYILNPVIERLQSILQGLSPQLIAAILLGLSAGVFEECSRYGMFRWWIKDNRTWRGAVLTGAGHGGIEAILLGILVMLAFTNLMAYRNIDVSKLNLTLDQLATAHLQIQSYWNAPWYATLLGAVERAFTIPFHIAASVIVLQVFTRRLGRQRLEWLGLAIFYHALMDASVVFIAGKWGGYAAEAFLGGFAILDLIIIFALRQPEPEPTEPPSISPPGKTPIFTPLPIEETSDNLDSTRYQ